MFLITDEDQSKTVGVDSTCSNLESTRANSENLTTHSRTYNMTRRELAARKDFLEELSDSAYELHKSMVEMCKVQSVTKYFYGMNSIETWVNVALTDDDTQPIYVKLHICCRERLLPAAPFPSVLSFPATCKGLQSADLLPPPHFRSSQPLSTTTRTSSRPPQLSQGSSAGNFIFLRVAVHRKPQRTAAAVPIALHTDRTKVNAFRPFTMAVKPCTHRQFNLEAHTIQSNYLSTREGNCCRERLLPAAPFPSVLSFPATCKGLQSADLLPPPHFRSSQPLSTTTRTSSRPPQLSQGSSAGNFIFLRVAVHRKPQRTAAAVPIALHTDRTKVNAFRPFTMAVKPCVGCGHIDSSILKHTPFNQIIFLPEKENYLHDDFDEILYSHDVLNSLQPSDMSFYKLILKVGVHAILLRNIDQKFSLHNGSRLLVIALGKCVIEAEINSDRQEFSFALCFAITINV
ncbi:hypothetical protein LXL04_002721 [Taraxacum kok-saghyz]